MGVAECIHLLCVQSHLGWLYRAEGIQSRETIKNYTNTQVKGTQKSRKRRWEDNSCICLMGFSFGLYDLPRAWTEGNKINKREREGRERERRRE